MTQTSGAGMTFVESSLPPETHLDDRNIATVVHEMLQGDGAHELELDRMVPGFGGERFGVLAHEQRRAHKVALRDIAPIDADALFESNDIGTREQSRAIPSGLQDARKIGAGGALAVRPRYVDEPTAVLTQQETEKLFDVLRKLKAAGCSVVLIKKQLRRSSF